MYSGVITARLNLLLRLFNGFVLFCGTLSKQDPEVLMVCAPCCRSGIYPSKARRPMPDQSCLANCKVLVLGAGGLGCEILKNLAVLGVPSIHVVDIDTVELSNLNRQFLFRENDIGKPKATVAADYINSLNLASAGSETNTVQVVPYVGDLTKLPTEFWKQFTLIISGLDAIEPRRYVNALLVKLTYETNFEKCIPLIDGGSEGFIGYCKTIIPGINACYECSIGTLALRQTYPMCTIANRPRLPEHIVMYIMNVEYSKVGFSQQATIEDAEVLQWAVERCKIRAREFGMNSELFTSDYILGVVKNIVPSVSTTNAIVAAACCNEFVKLVWNLVDDIEGVANFMQCNGQTGCFIYSFTYDKLSTCIVCGNMST